MPWELSPSIFISGQSRDDGPLAGDGDAQEGIHFSEDNHPSTLNGMCLSVFQTEDSYVRSNMYRNEEISSIVSPRSPRSNTGLQRSEPLGEVVMTCILMCFVHPQQCWWDVCLMLYTVLYSWETHCSGLGLSTAIEMIFPCCTIVAPAAPVLYMPSNARGRSQTRMMIGWTCPCGL